MANDKSKSAQLRAAFMRWSLQRILAGHQGGAHPLAFLLDPATRSWKSRAKYSHDPAVQAGHLTSRHSGEPERFALEDATFNQWSSNRGESQGAIFYKEAVEIGGVPVERRTAMQWESAGLLVNQAVRTAIPSNGWTG